MAGPITPSNVPPAPGAMTSPQVPGMVPDWTTVPTHIGEMTPGATSKARPLSQFGTAEELARVFRRIPGDQLQPADFEQAPASLEEMRKANPADLTPIRPQYRPGQEPSLPAGDSAPLLTSGE